MITIDLGRGVFRALSSTLSLTLKASADIQLDPGAIGTKETELLQLVQSGEIWLTQAPEVKVQICIRVQPDLAHYASTFLAQAGELLRSSKIWSDLGLAVLYKCCDHVYEKDESNCIRLSFGLRRMAGQSTSSKRRLPSTLQGSHEAVPPAGIPTARLSSVTVSLEYKSNQEINKYTQIQLHTTPSSSSLENSQYDNISGSPFPWAQFPPGKAVIATPGNNTTASFMRELQDSTEDWTIPRHDILQWNDDNESTQEFNKLLDIGLRILITQEPAGITNAIIKDMSTHLSELAPTVFSLGYTQAVNQRTQFIPSISKSITSIIQRKSPTRQKHPESKTPSPEERKSRLKTHIKQSLWRIAQKQLFNPKASSNLTPLQTTDSAFIPNDELMEYITEEDDVEGNNDNSDMLVSDEESIEPRRHTTEPTDPCPIIDADKDAYYSPTLSNTDDELLDFDFDFDTGNNQDSMSTICEHEHELPLPFPSPGTSNSCPRTSSSRRLPLQGISSESEMLTDPDPDPGPGPVDEKMSQLGSERLDYGGFLSDEVDMLSSA